MASADNHWGKLMASAQAGDKKAYAQLLQEIYPAIRRFLISRLGILGSEDDIVQECLMAVHKARHTYDPSRNFQSWMFSVAKYKAIDLLRKKQRQWAKEIIDDEIIATFSTPATNTDIEEEQAELVNRALDALPEDMRRAVKLTKIDGLNTVEASKQEGISTVALRSRVSRAYKVMRKYLEKDLGN